MPEPAKALKTPDPALTGEAGAAYISAILGAVVVLFKLNLSSAQQAAAVTVIVSILTGAILLHGAIVRKGRAAGGGLVHLDVHEIPVAASDPGDRAHR